MRTVKITRLRDGKTVAQPCLVTETHFERLRGLLGRSGLEAGSGLLIVPCNSIHTLFMQFPIDVLYLEKDSASDKKEVHKILAIRRGIKPYRLDWPVFRASSVLELPMGGAEGLEQGDLLCLS